MFAALVKKKKKKKTEVDAGFALFSRTGGGEVQLLTSIFAKSVRLRVCNKLPGGEVPENTSALWKSFILQREDDCWLPNLLLPLFINLRRRLPYERNLLHSDPSPFFRITRSLLPTVCIPSCPLRGRLCAESTRRLFYSKLEACAWCEEAAITNVMWKRRQDCERCRVIPGN